MTTEPLDPIAPFRLDDRVAIVTGASSGLGDRFARVLAAAGAKVVASKAMASTSGRLTGWLAHCGSFNETTMAS